MLLKTSWEKSPAKNVKAYEIFSFNTKIATISAKEDLTKKMILRPPDRKVTPPYVHSLESKYRIRAVDKSGNVSTFIHLDIE